MPAKKSKTSSANKKPVKSLNKSQMRSTKGGADGSVKPVSSSTPTSSISLNFTKISTSY